MLFFLFFIQQAFSQYNTTTAGGEWTDPAYWNTAPSYTNVDNNVTIDHYIYSNSSITYQTGGGNKHSLTVNDTLIIYGNLTMGSFDDVTVGAAGVLIIFGNFSAENQVNVGNGGYFVVLGDYNLDSGGSDHTNTGDGSTYITGDVTVPGGDELDCDPNIDDPCGFGDGSDLIDDPIFDFIDEISDQTCNLTLSSVITDESSAGANDGAIDVTLTGATSPSFTWSNDSITEDITGLAPGRYILIVFDGVCVLTDSFDVAGACTPPTVASSTNAERCGTGTLTLNATASSGTIDWYDSPTGGTALATGTNNFTTPSLSSTTSYYAEAVDGACVSAARTEVIATINAVPAPVITGSVTSCEQAIDTYSTPLNSGNTYTWSVSGGVLQAANGVDVNSMDIQWNTLLPAGTLNSSETVSVTESDGTCSGSANLIITVNRVPQTGPQHHIDNTWGN